MQVDTDQTTVSTIRRGPIPLATSVQVGAIADITVTERRSRQQDDRRNNQSDAPAQFRAMLDAATVAGFGQTQAFDISGAKRAALPRTEVFRARTPSKELNGADSEAMFRAARAYASSARASSAKTEDDDDVAAPPVSKHAATQATSRYAQVFFTLDRSFARRGESLEIST